MIFLGLGIVLLLLVLFFLLSSLNNLISNSSKKISGTLTNPNDVSGNYSYDIPYIYFNMSYNEVEDLLGPPNSTLKKNNDIYAYWGNSYIIFNKEGFVIGWKNNGDFYTDAKTGEESKQLQQMYNVLQKEFY